MLGNYKELLRMMKLINNPNDTLMGGKDGLFIDQQVEIQMETLQRKVNTLKASMQGLTFDVGVNGGGLEALKTLVDYINNAVIGVQKLGDKWGGTALTLLKVAGAVKVLFELWKKVLYFKEVWSAMNAVMAMSGARANALSVIFQSYLNNLRQGTALKATDTVAEALNNKMINQNSAIRGRNSAVTQGQAGSISVETAATNANTAATLRNVAAIQKANATRRTPQRLSNIQRGVDIGLAGAGAASAIPKMTALGRAATMASAGIAALGGPIGIAIAALTILVPLITSHAEKLGEEANAAQKAKEALDEHAYAVENELSKINQREHAADSLANAYNNLQDKIESGTMVEEEATKAKEQLKDIEKTLIEVVGDRSKVTIENGKISVKTLKEVFQVEKDAAIGKLEADKSAILSEKKKTEATIEFTMRRMEALKAEVAAQKAQYEKSMNIWKLWAAHTRERAEKLRKNKAISEEEYNNMIADANATETEHYTGAMKEYAELEKTLEGAKASLKEQEDKVADIDTRITGLKDIGIESEYNPGDVSEDVGKSKKSSDHDRGGYHNNRYAQTDPVVNAINNAVKNIQSKLNDQIKELQRIQKKQGASKENTLAQDKAYEKAINATKAQIEKARGHFEAGNSKLFNGEIMQSMRDNLTNEILSEAQTWLDTPYVMGGTTKSGVDCSAFVQNVLGQVGINLQRTADYQAQQYIDSGNFDTDLVNAKVGDLVFFKDTYDAGPGVNGATHVGIVSGIDSNGNVQMINASSSSGVSYANVNSGFWGDHFYGVGHNGGMTGASIPFSEKLAEFLTTTIDGVVHRITQEEWDSAGYEGQLSYIRAAKEDEANKSEERQALLSAAENELLGSAKAFKDAMDAMNDMIEQAADTYIKNINAEVSSATRKVERETNRRLAELGSGATETDKARAEVEKATAALKVYKDAMERDASEKYKDTEQFKDFIDDFYKGQNDALAKQVALIEAQYNDAMKIVDHNAKMRDYGVDNTEDAWGQQRATDAYSDLLTKRKALNRELEDLDKADPKYIDKHNSIQEELVAVNKEIRDASTQHIRTIRQGYSDIVKELVFEGKDIGEVLSNLWVELGKNAWDLLLTGKVDNPSFLAQLLGFGDVDKDAAELQSEQQWAQIQQTTGSVDTKMTTANNYLAQILSVLSTGSTFGYDKYGKYDSSVSFGENIKRGLGLSKTYDTSVPFSKALPDLTESMFKMDRSMFSLNNVLKNSNTLTQRNTAVENNLSNNVWQNSDALSDTNNFLLNLPSMLGGLLGGKSGSGWGSLLGGIIGLFTGGGGGEASWSGGGVELARGGSIPKFADGGAPAGRIKGAGTGRSDSILAYMRNKDKFVWLSDGEYVINEKSAKALGYDTLDKLNGYATGGPLDTSITNPTPYVPTINPQVAQRTTTIYGSNKMTEYLLREQNKQMAQQNEMLKNMNAEGGNGRMIVLNTQASSADVLRALQENPRAVQAIMGQQRNMGFR